MDKTGWGRYQKRSLLIPGQPTAPWKATRQGNLSRGHRSRGLVVLPSPDSYSQWTGPRRPRVWPVCVTKCNPWRNSAISSRATLSLQGTAKCQVWVAYRLRLFLLGTNFRNVVQPRGGSQSPDSGAPGLTGLRRLTAGRHAPEPSLLPKAFAVKSRPGTGGRAGDGGRHRLWGLAEWAVNSGSATR